MDLIPLLSNRSHHSVFVMKEHVMLLIIRHHNA